MGAINRKNHLDGLRGIAIILVVIFHTNSSILPNGYLGVDIFFTLSGYLIAKMIFNHEINIYSILKFYKNRFYRIFPVMIIVLFFTLLFGLYILLPEELHNLTKNAFHIMLIDFNLIAAKNIDYFSIKTIFQPLIHFWSLSIELQFYIFFPILLIFFKYLNKRSLVPFLIILFLVSLFYTFFADLNISDRYFFTMTRIWEFLLGVILYNVYVNNIMNINNISIISKEIIMYISLFLFVLIVFFIPLNNTPNIYTFILLICISIFILFGMNSKSKVIDLISFKILANIGTISYSLYLIHQPILAYYRILVGRELYIYESLIALLIIIILSIFSWKFVEEKYKKGMSRNFNYVFMIMLFFVVIVSYFGKINKLPQYNIDKRTKSYLSYRYDNNPRLRECRTDAGIINPASVCFYGNKENNKKVAFWGDSHIDQITLPLSQEFNKKKYTVYEFAIAGCPPIPKLSLANGTRKCFENNKVIYDYLLKNNEIKDIVIFSYWDFYISHNIMKYKGERLKKLNYDKKLQYLFRDMIKKLLDSGKRVHVIYPIPRMNVNPPLYLSRMEYIFGSSKKIVSINDIEYKNKSANSIKFLDASLKDLNVNKIYISEYLREKNKYIANNDSEIYYRDDNHLSVTGGRYIAKKIVNKIDNYILGESIEE